jgi:predicted Zn finger-like uncharacterized protein
MILVCPGCKNQITLDDASVPEGIFKVRCTGCGKIITSQRSPEAVAPSISQSGVTERKSIEDQSVNPAVEAFLRKEIATAKKEILDAMQSLFRGANLSADEEADGTAKRALICSGDPLTSQRLASAAKALGYATEIAVTAADSLKSLESFYSLMIIDPSFTDDAEGVKKLIGRVNIRKAVERRQMFLVLISASQKTLDGNSAFLNGVNLIVNKADLGTIENSIKQSQKDFRQMYSSFYEVSHSSM